MAVTQEKLLRTRKRLLTDFQFYAQQACKIRTKSGEIKPLVLNRVQVRFLKHIVDQLATTGRIRSVILKGRQQGLSTVVSAYLYWWLSQHAAQKGIVIAHVKDSTQTLFDMYKRFHDAMPDLLKPKTKYSSRREIVFDALDTGLMVATAGSENIARGETLQCMHLSEVAFWPTVFARENFNGLIKSLPNAPKTMCFVESTANGVTGGFYDLWQGAVTGTNGYVPFFSAWFESDEYRETPPAVFEKAPEEVALAAQFGLDDAQLYWRRREIALNGLELFRQEYPCTADEAFITSGRPVFNTEVLQDMLAKAHAPITRMSVELGKLVEHSRGELLVYHKREETAQYYVGADVAVGIRDPDKGDWCVAQVLDQSKRQVAVWRGQVTPDEYARVLFALGTYYNLALVAPERNGHGLLVCVRLHKDMNYPNIFMDLKEGALADRETLDLGFQTNISSRPLIIDKLRGYVRSREIQIYDHQTLTELLSFVSTETGKMQGESGCFDDCVLSLAIAAHVAGEAWCPISVGDEYYSEAI
jgi:hypothetical protein